MKGDLHAAFPSAMRKKFAGAIDEHRLRAEIVATKLANRIVNRLGVLHPLELAEEEGASTLDIAAMFVAAERLFDLPALWAERSDEHTSELQSLLSISYAVPCLQKTTRPNQ